MKKFISCLTLFGVLVVSFGMASCKKDEVAIPGKNIFMMTTEVTQKMYEDVMGENPSYFKGENNPVDSVNWYDAIYFCNKLSEKRGYEPVYAVDGNTDVSAWGYIPHNPHMGLIQGVITQKESANGFRLPTFDEWEYAANGGQGHKYAGSDNLDEVGWYDGNSGDTTHPVAQKKANGYGLYDMSGNVSEWLWDLEGIIDRNRELCGGGFDESANSCKVGAGGSKYDAADDWNLGFRLVRRSSK